MMYRPVSEFLQLYEGETDPAIRKEFEEKAKLEARISRALAIVTDLLPKWEAVVTEWQRRNGSPDVDEDDWSL
jgi:hypothetical protein